LYDDTRRKTAELYYDRFPYTVEFSYELSYSGFVDWPDWIAQDEEAVEHSRFEIVPPPKYPLRYWTNSDSVHPAESVRDGRRHYVWEVRNLPQLSPEMLEEDIEHRTLVVMTAPTVFQLEDRAGEMSSWKSFGAWDHRLFVGRDMLPPGAIQDVQRVVGPGDSPRQKVLKLYEYMQSRTRYVSVQLGIGGFQPFDATYVHERGYGDCKALSNYMVALLKAAGITAYPVLIKAGRSRSLYLRDFPSQQFNHVIVCVPLGRDSVWLECTDQTSPAGHLGDFTENRFGLLITPAGGVIVQTPASSSSDNVQYRVTRARLAASGTAEISMTTHLTGDQQDLERGYLADASAEDRSHWILDHLQLPNAQLRNFAFDGFQAHKPELTILADVSVPRYSTVSGSRLFFFPNIAERQTDVPRRNPNRRSPVRYPYPYIDVDSVLIAIPHGYVVESLPQPTHQSTSFISFHSNATMSGDSVLIYTRRFEVRQAVIPASDYEEFCKIYASIVKTDRQQAVFVISR
jgi:transglutaminase-like putative cysteine protease